MIRLLSTLVLALTLLTGPVAARDLTGPERTALAQRIDGFSTAMRTGDVPAMIDVTPPRMLKSIAEQVNVTTDELREQVIKQVEGVVKDVTFDDMEMALDQAEFSATEDGIPYALIPTSFVMTMKDAGKFQTKSHTLALLDEGKWYLIRVDDAQQLLILRRVYPGFEGIEFPRGSMTAIK